MNLSQSNLPSRIFKYAFFVYVFSLFLTLGSDEPFQVYARMCYGGFLLIWFFLTIWQRPHAQKPLPWTLIIFSLFIIYQLIRLGWVMAERYGLNAAGLHTQSLSRFAFSPLTWSFFLGLMLVSYLLMCKKQYARELLWILSVSGALLAANVLPAVLLYGHPWYVTPANESVFFCPVLYSNDFIRRYVIGHFAHANYTGDVMAVGMFASVGILFYSLMNMRETKGLGHLVKTSSIWLSLTCAAVTGLAVFLLLSRGTIVCFLLAFLYLVIAVLMKYPSKKMWISSLIIILAGFVFLLSYGNLKSAWKEIGSLKNELNPNQTGSLSVNREGAKRALAIHRAFPVWGVGTGGYGDVSVRFSTPGREGWLLIKFKAMCHYLQILAENGVGAYLYFLFLLVYAGETVCGLIKTDSRFQYMAAASLSAAVLMVFGHALINQLMERFSVSLLIYILMGASLGVLRKDFEHS